VVSALDQRPRGRGFESVGCGLSRSNRGPVALCTLGLSLLNPPSSRGRFMSTGYSREGIRQVRATLLCAHRVPERLCGGYVYLGRYIKCSTVTFFTQQPTYLSSFISYRHSSLLRSTGQSPLNIPRTKTNLVVVPSPLQLHKIWNQIPLVIQLFQTPPKNPLFHHSMRFQLT